VGFAPLPLRGAPQVHPKERQQHERVVERDPLRERDQERVEAGDAEEGEFRPPARVEPDARGALAAPLRAPGEKHGYERPAEAEQQSVAARHVETEKKRGRCASDFSYPSLTAVRSPTSP